jgi:hypothetical protein
MEKVISPIKVQVVFLVLLTIAGLNATAQLTKPLKCPEPKISKERLQKMKNNNQSNLLNKTLALTAGKQIRVFFVICANTDGTAPAATTAQVLQEFATMQADFAPGNICFINAGISQVNNTTLNHIDLDNNSDAEDLFEGRRIPGCLTIFYTREIRGTNSASGGTIGGYAFDIPNTFCIVSSGNLGGNTSSHEVGHCLGLLHTFADAGRLLETISGSNCDHAGDLVCDTRSDPYNLREEDCYREVNNFYTGTCKDSEGNSNYSPPYTNIMSYWGHNPETFTNGQFAVMHDVIETEDDIKALTSGNNLVVYAGTYYLGYIYKSSINAITTIGNLKFLQLSRAGMFAKSTTLTAGFQAKPAFDGYTVIKAVVCSGLSASPLNLVLQAAKAPEVNKTPELMVTADKFTVYPNPSTGQITLRYVQGKLFDAVINIWSIDGKLVYTQLRKNSTNLQEQIQLRAKGMYLIELKTGDKNYNQKVLIQ